MKRLTKSTDQKANMVGDKVKKFRTEIGMSQQALADKLELDAVYVCRGSIARIESGERTVTDMELWGLSRALRKPISAFFEE